MTASIKPNLEDLICERAVFEFRYAQSYLIWDRIGAIWQEINKKIPDLQNLSVEPNVTKFRIGRKAEITIQIDSCNIIFFGPKNINDFIESAKIVCQIVTNTLEIETYTRIGARFIYYKEFKSKEDASTYFLNTGLINPPSQKLFNIDSGKVLNPELLIRNENESVGYTVRLRATEYKIFLNVPLEVGSDAIQREGNRFEFDVDYYTKSLVGRDQLDVISWIKQFIHLVNRDSKYYLGI